jgi:polyhydroxybutyrate depolymerase
MVCMVAAPHASPEEVPSFSRSGVSSEWRTVEFGGRLRRYLLAEPSGRPDGVLSPVIIDLHGSGLDVVEHLATTRSDRVCRRGGIVLLPEAAMPFRLRPEFPLGHAWNVPGAPLVGEQVVRAEAPDDIGFIEAMLSDIEAIRRVDRAHVYAMGFSGGARLCCYLAKELPDRLASIGVVAGLRFPRGLNSTAVAVVAIHGRSDDINPYLGGTGPRWDDSVCSAAEAWATAAGAWEATELAVQPGVHERRWGTAGVERVRLVTVDTATHCWPGSVHKQHRRDFGVFDGIDATATLLSFFNDHQRNGRAPSACDQRSS